MARARTTTVAAAALASSLAAAQAPAPQIPCQWQWTDPNLRPLSSWDLSAAFNASSDYGWNDRNDAYVKNNTYYFNVCSNTLTTPPFPACQGQGNAPAWQVDGGANNACYPLGLDLTNNRPAPVTYSLIDFRYPSRGVAMTYLGGSPTYCPNGGKRSFTINFWCAAGMGFPPASTPQPGVNASFNGQYWIDEFNTCAYVANVYSVLGCPRECPRGANNAVCSGNGVCGFDNNAMTSRCFCNDDYIESDCSAPRYPTPTGSIAGAVIGGLLLGAVGVVGALYVLQRRRAAAGGAAVDGFYGVVQ